MILKNKIYNQRVPAKILTGTDIFIHSFIYFYDGYVQLYRRHSGHQCRVL